VFRVRKSIMMQISIYC